VAFSADGRHALSGSNDNTVRYWEVASGRALDVFEGHTASVMSVAFSGDGRHALSGADDRTVRLWEVASGRALGVLKGHTDSVTSVAFSGDGRHALSGADDRTVRFWEVATGRVLGVFEGHTDSVMSVAFSADGCRAFSAASNGVLRVWELPERDTRASVVVPVTSPDPDHLPTGTPEQLQYTNAKVLLVGDSGTGKTGLSMRLAENTWRHSDSTVGAWATQWRLGVSATDGVEREIWLWDFGGQADQRLIHQLFMDEARLAVLVFDPQKDDVFDTLGQWDRDLTRVAKAAIVPRKLLVGARIDAGGLRVACSRVEAFAAERGFAAYLETSARVGTGCDALRDAIMQAIRWDELPWRSSPRLFKRLKDEIIRFKDERRVLMRFKDLRDSLALRMPGESFRDEELEAVLGLLEGPGIVWKLAFGSWVLLQPERVNAYAQAVIQTLRSDRRDLGTIAEDKVLRGELAYQSSLPRLSADDERIVLLAMHQILVERGLCLREHTEHGTQLVFPSFYRRERRDVVGHPAVFVSYRFDGFLDDIYATLVVRLHHAASFQQAELWRYAADFKTLTDKRLGVKLTRRAEGAGELEVYFDPDIAMPEQIIFSKYVHEHLLRSAGEGVARLRHYVCSACRTPVGNREVAMARLAAGKQDIVCAACEARVPALGRSRTVFCDARGRAAGPGARGEDRRGPGQRTQGARARG
jgi:small GTP-binding protein